MKMAAFLFLLLIAICFSSDGVVASYSGGGGGGSGGATGSSRCCTSRAWLARRGCGDERGDCPKNCQSRPEMSRNDVREVLKLHNAERSALGLPLMQWDDTLAKFAQGHVNMCCNSHGNTGWKTNPTAMAKENCGTGRGEFQCYGQNAASHSDIVEATKAWIDEKNLNDERGRHCGSQTAEQMKDSHKCGHYAAIIAKKIVKVGCAINPSCTGQMSGRTRTGNFPNYKNSLAICNYSQDYDKYPCQDASLRDAQRQLREKNYLQFADEGCPAIKKIVEDQKTQNPNRPPCDGHEGLKMICPRACEQC